MQRPKDSQGTTDYRKLYEDEYPLSEAEALVAAKCARLRRQYKREQRELSEKAKRKQAMRRVKSA